MSWLARIAPVAAAAAVAAAVAGGGRGRLITLGVGATTFLILLAALAAAVVVLHRGEFPRRIGREGVEFTADDDEATATSLAAIDATIEEMSAKLDDLAASVIVLTDRVDAIDRRQ